MTIEELLGRISTNPDVCGGEPCIRGTRIPVGVILDSMAEGASMQDIIDNYPALQPQDIRAAFAYAAEIVRENIWKLSTP